MGGFGLIMVYKTEKMGDGCMSCPCDSRQIAIALDLVSLDLFILFFSFRMGKKKNCTRHTHIYIHPIHTHLLPYYSKFSLWRNMEHQQEAKPFLSSCPPPLSQCRSDRKK